MQKLLIAHQMQKEVYRTHGYSDAKEALQGLSVRFQELTNLLKPSSNGSSALFPSEKISSLIAQAQRALIELQIAQLYHQAITQGVWDFFPTPRPVIEKMLALAHIKAGMRVLEPSAGLGHICREVKRLGVIPDCFEISPLLRRGLRLQGFNVLGDDFLSHTPTALYDRVLANPPFSANGIARHTLRALDWLRPGGCLVTVAHHYQLRPSSTDRAFFRWLQGFEACFYDCGAAFERGDRPCSVPVQLIVIQKPRW